MYKKLESDTKTLKSELIAFIDSIIETKKQEQKQKEN